MMVRSAWHCRQASARSCCRGRSKDQTTFSLLLILQLACLYLYWLTAIDADVDLDPRRRNNLHIDAHSRLLRWCGLTSRPILGQFLCCAIIGIEVHWRISAWVLSTLVV